jgi:putative Ca2+/H+ antiporter (TMEM165/GDT1 family)
VPAVLIGDGLSIRLPIRLLQRIAAALFAILGVLALAG